MQKNLLLLALLSFSLLFSSSAFALTVPPYFTQTNNDYVFSSNLFSQNPLVRMQNGDYYGIFMKSYSAVSTRLMVSQDNGTTWQNVTTETGQFCSNGLSFISAYTFQNELYFERLSCSGGGGDQAHLYHVNKANYSIINDYGMGNKNIACASNSTNLFCASGNADIDVHIFDKNLTSLVTDTCLSCSTSSNREIAGFQTSENTFEWLKFDGTGSPNSKIYYGGNYTVGSGFGSSSAIEIASNTFSDGFVSLWASLISFQSPFRKIVVWENSAGNLAIGTSSDGVTWAINDTTLSINAFSPPSLVKYKNESYIFYYSNSAIYYIDSDDFGATWESPVLIIDDPSHEYSLTARASNYPDYNNQTSHFNSTAGFIDLLVQDVTNDYTISFLPVKVEDIVEPILPPSVTILTPVTTINSLSVSLTFSASSEGTLASCWYSLDGGANVTVPNCISATFTTTVGSHSITVYANDTLGNFGSDTSSFNIVIIPPQPKANILLFILPILLLVLFLFYIIFEAFKEGFSTSDLVKIFGLMIFVIIAIIMIFAIMP